MDKKIGFIGLGAMGSKIAGRLINPGGFNLGLYNRSSEKADELVEQGGWLAGSPKQLAEKSDVIFTCVTDGNAIKELMEGEQGAFAGAKPGTIFIDCSTISALITQELAAKAKNSGFHWLDAPVLGGPKMAEDGEMPFVVGGSEEILEEVKEILETVGKKIVYMGGPGLGQAAKLVHNLTCGIFLVAYSESLFLGEKLGLSKKQILEVLQNGVVGSTLLNMKEEKFEKGEFEQTNAPMVNILKDLTLATDAASSLEINLPTLQAAKEMYDKAKEHGLGQQDTSSVFKVLEIENDKK